jgi:hypothetical protein
MKKKETVYKFYDNFYQTITDNLAIEMFETISPDLKSFQNIKQDLNILNQDENRKNIGTAIAKYNQTIRNIFESLTDLFSKKKFNSPEFMLLSRLSTNCSYPKKKYFTDFELSRIDISCSGMLKLKSERQQLMIFGGYLIIRILLMRIIFEIYSSEMVKNGQNLETM